MSDIRDKQTEILAKSFQVKLLRGYQDTEKAIKKEIDNIFKYAVDGKVTMAEMQKYKRLQGIEKKINTELTALNRGTYSAHKKYLTDVFETNYYMTGYLLESKTARDISYSILNRQAIYESVLSPMDKIGISNNAVLVRQNIKRDITSGIIQGKGVREMSKSIHDSLGKNINNAYRIARTETTGIMNKARTESALHAETKGFKIQQRWITGVDARVRDLHVLMEGELVWLDEAFSNGLMYPGDQSGSAEEVINCRCTVEEIVVKINENRKIIETYGNMNYPGYNEWKKERLKI